MFLYQKKEHAGRLPACSFWMTESNDDKIVFAGTLKDLNPKNPGWVMIPPDPANALVKECQWAR